MNGLNLIAAERARQISVLGRTIEGDITNNGRGQLAEGALALIGSYLNWEEAESWWPSDWCERNWDTNPVRDLVKAGALIAAELDRLIATGVKL